MKWAIAIFPSLTLALLLLLSGVAAPSLALIIILSAATGLGLAFLMPDRGAPDPAAPGVPDEAMAERVFQSLPHPFILIDWERRVRRLNQAAEEEYGEQAVGADLSKSLRHPRILEAVDSVLNGGRGGELELDLPTPVRRVYAVYYGPYREAGKIGAVLLLHDVTGAKRAEQLRTDFVANVSHELRTPLASLSGFVETLLGPAESDPVAQKRFLGIMQTEAQRMTRLIDDLLSLSRVETNEHIAPTGKVDAQTAVRSVVDALEVQATEKNISITIEAAADLPTVRGDTDQLTQVFNNLINNAIKYSPVDGVVRLEMCKVTRMPNIEVPGVAISVIDQGEGIPPEDLPRLTERFYRVDKARSRALGGTGLSLAIVKHIVARHRGRLSIESTFGEGTRFTVVLPVSRS